jgi:cytochrome P450
MSHTPSTHYPLTSGEFLAEPHPHFHRMRQEDPVYWSDEIQAWVLTRYEDVLAGFQDPRLSNRRTEMLVNYQLAGRDPTTAKDFARVVDGMMVMRDGEDHHRLRILGNRGFTPTLLENFRAVIQWVVDQLLDKVQAAGRMDIVTDLAQPFPSIMIAELFGIPEDDRFLFQKWADDVVKFWGGTLGNPEEDARAANAGAIQLEQYFLRLLKKRGSKPGTDLMGLFIAGQNEGRLSPEEVCHQCVVILNAGHVTTIDQLANAVNAFLIHPDQFQRLRDDPSLLRSAVEEVLRFDPALPLIHRVATEDLEIGGKAIRKGQVVYLGMAAANRDPEIFPDPDRFDIARPNNRHLSFAAGPHVCLGAGLARRELEIGLATLFRRMQGLRLNEASPPRRRCESLVFRGFSSLPVCFATA